MKIENQVTNLEISKRLKELNVKQESFLTYCASTECETYKNGEYKLVPFREFYGSIHDYHCAGRDNFVYPMFSAFTVAELGEMLPEEYVSGKVEQNEGYVCFDNNESTFPPYENRTAKYSDTEANARGKMLIYLLENNLIKSHE